MKKSWKKLTKKFSIYTQTTLKVLQNLFLSVRCVPRTIKELGLKRCVLRTLRVVVILGFDWYS